MVKYGNGKVKVLPKQQVNRFIKNLTYKEKENLQKIECSQKDYVQIWLNAIMESDQETRELKEIEKELENEEIE
jgi:hypothetical protein